MSSRDFNGLSGEFVRFVSSFFSLLKMINCRLDFSLANFSGLASVFEVAEFWSWLSDLGLFLYITNI